MTKMEWLINARATRTKVRKLVGNYHPVLLLRTNRQNHITAPNAEGACEVVRGHIRKNFEGDPVAQYEEALDMGLIDKALNILNETWFGVPESTSCWEIEGFKELVSLLEEPPDDDESEVVH